MHLPYLTRYRPFSISRANPAAQGGAKIAAIDLDGTMIARKSTNQWGPKDADDWKWLTATVPAKIKELHEGGYKLVIFTNQGSIKGAMLGAASDKIRAMIDNVLKGLSTAAGTAIPAQVLIATTNDNFRKPGTGMWEFFVENLNGGVAPDLAESFFVGDAAGRSEDINGGAASDKEFAAAIGIKFILPEDFWCDQMPFPVILSPRLC